MCINSWGCLNIRIIEYAELQTNSDMQRSASDGQQMQQIVQLLQEMNERLKRIESRETAESIIDVDGHSAPYECRQRLPCSLVQMDGSSKQG